MNSKNINAVSTSCVRMTILVDNTVATEGIAGKEAELKKMGIKVIDKTK